MQAAQAQGRDINKAWFYFALCLIVFGSMTGVMMVPALLVEIATDLNVSVAVAGQLATATFAAWAVSIVFVGPLADSIGRRPMALGGVVLIVVSLLASGFHAQHRSVDGAPCAGRPGRRRTCPHVDRGDFRRHIPGQAGPGHRRHCKHNRVDLGHQHTVNGTVRRVVGLAVHIRTGRIVPRAAWVLNWFWYPRDNRESLRGFVFFARYRALLSLNYFRLAMTVNVTQRMAYWSLLSFFAAYLIQAYDVSVGFVAIPLVISALGQVVGCYTAGMVATRSYRVALVAATSAAGGVCGFLFFVVDLGLWPAVAVGTVSSGLLSVMTPVLLAGSTEYSGVQGHGSQPDRLQQPDRRSLRGRTLRRAAGDHGLPGDWLPLHCFRDRQRAGGDRVRQATARGQRLKRPFSLRMSIQVSPARRGRRQGSRTRTEGQAILDSSVPSSGVKGVIPFSLFNQVLAAPLVPVGLWRRGCWGW